MKKYLWLRTVAAFLLSTILGGLFWLTGCLIPDAEQRADTAAAERLRYCTEQALAAMSQKAGDTVRILTDSSGKVTAVRTDRDALTAFKAELDSRLWEQTSNGGTEISLPYGLRALVLFPEQGTSQIRTELLPGGDGSPVYRIFLKVTVSVEIQIGKRIAHTTTETESVLFEAILK